MRIATIIAVILFFSAALVLSGQERTWTDRTGQFRIKASLLDFDGKFVKLLHQGDGKVLSIPLEKFSAADQLYVKKTMEALANEEQEPKDDSPAARFLASLSEDEKRTPSGKRSPTGSMWEDDENQDGVKTQDNTLSQLAKGAFSGKIFPVRLENAKLITLAHGPTTWSIEPDPPIVTSLDFRPKPLFFTYKEVDRRVEVRNQRLFFCDRAPEKVLTAVTFSNTSFGANEQGTKVFLGDLKTGQFQSQTWPALLYPRGLSPDGTHAIFVQEQIIPHEKNTSHFSKEKSCSHLTFADMTQENYPCVGVLCPFADEEAFRPDRDRDDWRKTWQNIRYANWIDEDHILVDSNNGRTMLFNVRTREAVWYTAGDNAVLALSSGKKHLLLHGDRPYLVETFSGKVIGRLQVPADIARYYYSGWRYAFSPDMTQIAVCTGIYVYFCNAKTGECTKPFYVKNFLKNSYTPYWLNENHVIIGGTLFDAKQSLPIWVYADTHFQDSSFAGLYWHLTERRNVKNTRPAYILTSFKLPPESLPPLPLLSEGQKYCVRPGAAVRLQIDREVPEYQKVLEYFTKTATDNGLVVSENAPLVLAVRIEREDSRKDVFLRDAYGVAQATHNFFAYSCSLEQDGKTYWQTSSRSGWEGVGIEELEDRSLQQRVTEKNKPDADWYLKVEFPKVIPYDKAGRSSLREMK